MIVDRATLERVERLLAEADPKLAAGGRGRRLFDEALEAVRGLLAESQAKAEKSDAVHRGDWFRQAWANTTHCSVEEAERAYETLGDITVTRRERLRRAGLLAEGEESREPETQEDDDLGFDGPTVGHCSKCGEVRTEFYTCRDGGETVAGGGP
jgi:hypothetical protein